VKSKKQTSKAVDEKLLKQMDIIITLCDDAAEACPWTPPEIKRIHWSLKDPAKATGTEKEVMNEFRRVRDDIESKVKDFIKEVQHVRGN